MSYKTVLILVFKVVVVAFIFAGCSQKAPEVVHKVQVPKESDELKRKAIVEKAMSYLNKKDGKDCSGFVALVNHQSGEPFYKEERLGLYFSDSTRSKAMFNLISDEDRTFADKLPREGDLIFFADTTQKSKRKKDSLNITHVGIVTQIDKDGTVHFIHHIQGKNKLGQINQNIDHTPVYAGKNINSYMKKCDASKSKKECLSAYFFSSYGGIVSKKDEQERVVSSN